MDNGTKAAKLRKYFKKNPEATARQAADWAGCSYGNAWSIKQEFCKEKPKASSDVKKPQAQPEVVNWSRWREAPALADDEFEKEFPLAPTATITEEESKAVVLSSDQTMIFSDGSTASYYELPEGAKELQDLISFKDMNAQMGEIFRGTYRYGQAAHSDRLRDAKKIKFYIDAEIKRLESL